jgi:hypothetical protein
MILKSKPDGSAVPYGPKETAKLVRREREKIGLPDTFTFDACRHGWHDGTRKSRADRWARPGAFRTPTQIAYAGYAKRTLARALPATCKRHAHMLASTNASGTAIQNEARNSIQNVGGDDDIAIA